MFILSVGWRSVFNVNRCLTCTSQAFIQHLPRMETTAACILSRQSSWGWCINYLHPLPSSVCVSSLPASCLWPVLWPLWVMRCLVTNNKHFLVFFLNFTSILCSSFCLRLCVTEMKHRFVQVNVSLGRITCHSAIWQFHPLLPSPF